MSGYRPSERSAPLLGNVVELLSASKSVSNAFSPAPRLLATLPGGELYFDGSLALDTDGWTGGTKVNPCHRPHTNLRYSDGTCVDSGRVSFFALPLPTCWSAQLGIRLGDYAAVVREDRLTYAVFADSGPQDTLAEGSIELFRRLGDERIGADGGVSNTRSLPGVVMIIFPGSGSDHPLPDEAALSNAIDLHGRACLHAVAKMKPTPGTALLHSGKGLAERIADAARAEIVSYGGCRADQAPLQERIALYRSFLAREGGDVSGACWSAAFVSYMVHLAGAGEHFHYSGQHSKLYHRQVNNRDTKKSHRFWTYRPAEIRIAPGDILFMNSIGLRIIDFPQGRSSDDYPGCADIVTSVDEHGIRTVGGNVGASPGTIGEKLFRWKEGFLCNVEVPGQSVYGLLRAPAV
jgi:Uncharacterized protein conserved in bacteria (DUF2272)/Fungal chitosanase of glycosyl hydrolase group 75